jgi:hypothetical protein
VCEPVAGTLRDACHIRYPVTYLLPVCSRHHHLVHEGGWRLCIAPDRTLSITRPDGTHHATARPDITTEREEHRERHRRRPLRVSSRDAKLAR